MGKIDKEHTTVGDRYPGRKVARGINPFVKV